jgi:hypothetical protein
MTDETLRERLANRLAWREYDCALKGLQPDAIEYIYKAVDREFLPLIQAELDARVAAALDAAVPTFLQHRLCGTDLVGWYGTCSCQKSGEMPVDFETEQDYINHLRSVLIPASAREELERHPKVTGASPICLDCNKAGLRNCSHFDNCDGTWVYRPDTAELERRDATLIERAIAGYRYLESKECYAQRLRALLSKENSK